MSERYEEKSVLHVMTASYAVGGHTRIIERWISSSSDNEKHSVFILKKERSQITEVLKEAVKNKKGQIYTLPFYYSDIKKALKLREIASKYSRIILHIHMNDPIALIAFGTPDFNIKLKEKLNLPLNKKILITVG